MDRSFRRLLGALAASLALHAAVLVPWSWPFRSPVDDEAARQVQIVVSIQPAPPQQPQPEPTGRKATRAEARAAADTRRLSAPSGRASITAGAEEVAPASDAKEAVPTSDAAEALPDRAAIVLDQPLPPEYPEEANRRGLEGCVLAIVHVAPSGEVEKVEIVAADVLRIFDQSVIDSQAAARYLPARQGGKAVAARVLAVAAFVLDPRKRLNCALRYAPLAEKLLSATGTAKQ